MGDSTIAKFSDELAAAAAQAGQSVVTVFARRRLPSSGVVWRDDTVVTVDHAIQREEDISVFSNEGKRISAKLAGRDPGTDLAVLKLDVAGGPVVSTGDSAQLKLGHLVLALGRARSGNLVASAGIIGGLGGESRTWRGGRLDQSIRLDLDLYPGFSGGPLVDVEGKVLGINTSGLGRGRAITIPTATVNRTVEELLEKGYIARPYLGVAMQPVRIPESAGTKTKSSTTGGLIVLHVERGGPAESAGIFLGDVIVEWAGRPALDLWQIREALSESKIGDSVALSVFRAGEVRNIPVKLAARPTK